MHGAAVPDYNITLKKASPPPNNNPTSGGTAGYTNKAMRDPELGREAATNRSNESPQGHRPARENGISPKEGVQSDNAIEILDVGNVEVVDETGSSPKKPGSALEEARNMSKSHPVLVGTITRPFVKQIAVTLLEQY